MSRLSLDVDGGRSRFQPGDELVGHAAWSLGEPPDGVELRLFWYTAGKGTRDVEVVATERFDPPAAEGRREFRLRLPAGPWSWSGTLVSIVWALELVVEGAGRGEPQVERHELVVGPGGREASPADANAGG